MKKNQDKWIVAFISITILITISAQVYSLLRHYKTSKRLLYKQVHFSLNKAVDTYFEDIAKGGIISLTSQDASNPNKTQTDTIRIKDRFSENTKASIDSTLQIISQKDSTKTFILTPGHGDKKGMRHFFSKKKPNKNIERLISKVYISFSRDSLDLKKLNKLIHKELKKHHIKIPIALTHTKKNYKSDKITTKTYGFEQLPKTNLNIKSNASFFLHRNEKLTMHYADENRLLLRRSLLEIFLSFLLSASIISCLLYLLYTINKQKQLAAIKNDFISNITHEFKTPIATVSAALEAVKNFNQQKDEVKTEKYVDMSADQMIKLNKMVEKLLETATLHTNELTIDKKRIDLIKTLDNISSKHQLITPEKKFEFKTSIDLFSMNLDIFHFENAIDNILENAVKYGGKHILTEVHDSKEAIIIKISDDGIGIPKSQTSKIFEQFYRIQKGNIHDTKGFGIGLYYTKKIIEKHNGKIYVALENKNRTTFKIELPK